MKYNQNPKKSKSLVPNTELELLLSVAVCTNLLLSNLNVWSRGKLDKAPLDCLNRQNYIIFSQQNYTNIVNLVWVLGGCYDGHFPHIWQL
jgi:hypothetical protein